MQPSHEIERPIVHGRPVPRRFVRTSPISVTVCFVAIVSPGRTGTPNTISFPVTMPSGSSNASFKRKCISSGLTCSRAFGLNISGRIQTLSMLGGAIQPPVTSCATPSSQYRRFAFSVASAQ